jgi:aspartate aminotransferase-like enzyme
MLSPLARERIDATTSTSFACDLRKWLQIMEAYENGGFAYHATMPTDGLATLRDVMKASAGYAANVNRTASARRSYRSAERTLRDSPRSGV